MTEVRPEVSVVIPTRNRASYLDACLASLAEQRCDRPFEVVVVDNGSTDATPEVVRAWGERDPRIRSVLEPTVGISAAKNAGAAVARGALLLFTDDDILLDPGWVQAYVDLFAGVDGPPPLAGGPLIPIPHDDGPWPRWFVPDALADIGALDHGAQRRLDRYQYVWGANMAIPAPLFAELGGFDTSVGRRGEERGTYEDVEYQERLLARGGAVWFCPAAVARHRVERSSVTPRQALRIAFARGRNECRRDGDRERQGRWWGRSMPRNLLTLGWLLGSWVVSAAILRLVPARWVFRRAHRASHDAGYVLDVVRRGRESGRFSLVLGRGAGIVVGVASALAPGSPG